MSGARRGEGRAFPRGGGKHDPRHTARSIAARAAGRHQALHCRQVQGTGHHRPPGLKVARRQIFVAGGPTGHAFTYDRRTGQPLRDVPLAGGSSFINDVAIARRHAYFTNSFAADIYAVALRGEATARRIPLTGDYTQQGAPGTFNLNGIAPARGGKVLIVVQSNTGRLYTVDPRTGVARTIDLGGRTLVNGDGILLKGRTLYVVQNSDDKIAVVRLSDDLRRGTVVREITAPGRFKVPTTIAFGRGSLYAVNAQFGAPSPATTEYDVVRVDRR